MGHYKSNLRDLEFNLFEVFGADQALGRGPFAQMDVDTARDVLREMDRLCAEDLAESFADSDRNPPVYDPRTYSVTLPESFKRSYQAVTDGEWHRLSLPESLGGLGASPSVIWAANELMLGANPAVFMYMAGGNFAAIIHRLGTAKQKAFAQTMVDRQWGATMVLTEPDAGSDVGAGRTVAHQQADGTWHIDGVKRFITSGDWDIPENIVHMVLARPDGAGPGTKGLSLFIVPKFHVTNWETGELGERNGAFVTNVEHKMGLKVSATCELSFGQNGTPAVGYLVGEVHDGIAQMFQVIEYARMMVGTKAISTLSTGYLNALDYAKTRVQGPDLTQMTDKTAPRVTITHHPDVRLMLMRQKAWAEGMRALVLYTAHVQDEIALAEFSAFHRPEGTDPKATDLLIRLNDLLLPVVKAYGSEKGYELLATSLQILGGSGYLQDYPIEQYLRDAKIDTLYEGTTSIQGMDFFFRKIIRDKGKALNSIAREMREFVKADPGDGILTAERDLLGRAMDDFEAFLSSMVGHLMTTAEERRNVYKVGLNTTRLLMAAGDVTVAWLLLRQAEVANAALASGEASARDQAFYRGKVASARWFARNVLPGLASARAVAEDTDLELMDLAEESF